MENHKTIRVRIAGLWSDVWNWILIKTQECPTTILSVCLSSIEKYTLLGTNFGCDVRLSLIVGN